MSADAVSNSASIVTTSQLRTVFIFLFFKVGESAMKTGLSH
jgi:hypothetical protein